MHLAAAPFASESSQTQSVSASFTVTSVVCDPLAAYAVAVGLLLFFEPSYGALDLYAEYILGVQFEQNSARVTGLVVLGDQACWHDQFHRVNRRPRCTHAALRPHLTTRKLAEAGHSSGRHELLSCSG